jgi:hypothetical protein
MTATKNSLDDFKLDFEELLEHKLKTSKKNLVTIKPVKIKLPSKPKKIRFNPIKFYGKYLVEVITA